VPGADTVWAPQAWITRTASSSRPAGSGALAGLSFAAKDNIDVAGVPTTAACPAFAYTPMAHAAVVQKLLDAGAQLLGKTNLDQFACGLNGTRSPYGAVPNAINPPIYQAGPAPARPMWWRPGRRTLRWAPTRRAPGACRRA
jgi:allophanate hydrolase